jgi:hypothetical protein
MCLSRSSLWILIVDTVDFFYTMFDYLFFKILILMYKIISYILNFFNDKSNHNKIYVNY